MTAHEFARHLLECPDVDLFGLDQVGPTEIDSSPRIYKITEYDEDNCGCCEGRVGEEVVIFNLS